MRTTDATSPSKRSFPELRDFLEKEILGAEYPVKHLIEQARSKGFISKGKPGRGGAKVTSRDVAILIVGALGGDTPQAATEMMGLIVDLSAKDTGFSVHFPEFGPADDWWDAAFLDAICHLIDDNRRNPEVHMDHLNVTVVRKPVFYAEISWEDHPGERDAFVSYCLPQQDERKHLSKGRRVLRASINGDYLRIAADWLENRSPYCETGPYRDLGRAT
ncbi:hypothetical protein XMV225_000814 [Aliiroseovarius sp. xm-v-225]|jgi:hypothetical protein|uniref:hypothetical protein n=1 Tax=unclassified Aliiroseovarius TaxID=2623558 RepID=UPI001568D763|nr:MULTISPECIES: hypothetical protein [unclassified Aliiroseovarius]NRP43658.1 hypothetical protein [Aliiroseovarius sp. xm-m-378]NRP64529.1 hypothetical protein [Aliiroseovarius sp. xm-v-225]NRP91590.1 hypothetical protein [Aliiroseovarius sp. xm-a-134]